VASQTKMWFTADTHFGHVNIVRYCGRPFNTIEQHDRTLIDNWNARVAPGDVVYHLGDFGLPQGFDDGYGYLCSVKARLNGQVHLVLGNHDKLVEKVGPLFNMFVTIHNVNTCRVSDTGASDGKRQYIFMSHYAHRTWKKSGHSSWNLYGHSHGNLADIPYLLQMDVGVDCCGFAPISYDEVKTFMAAKVPSPVDHHGRRGDEH